MNIIITKEFIDYIKYRAGKKNHTNYYAQILKIERLKRHMTLEEAARGICSISYLSKLENQNIEGVNNEYLKFLCERYEIPYDALNQVTDVDTVLDCIRAYFFHDYDKIIEIYESMPKITFNSPQALVSCLYFFIKKDYASLEDEMKNIDAVKFTLCDVECLIFVFLLSLYHITVHNYKEAYDILKAVSTINSEDLILKLLMLEATFVAALHIGKIATLIKSYEDIEKNMFLGYPEAKRTIMRLIYDIAICDEFPQNVLDDLKTLRTEGYKEKDQNKISYFTYVCKLKLALSKHDLLSIYDEIKTKNLISDPEFIGLACFIALKLNARVYYREIEKTVLEHIDNYKDDLNNIHLKFFMFTMNYASFSNDKEVIEYMRYNIMNNLNNEQHFLYNKVYIETFSELLAKDGKYKDAYLYSDGDKKDIKAFKERIHVLKVPTL